MNYIVLRGSDTEQFPDLHGTNMELKKIMYTGYEFDPTGNSRMNGFAWLLQAGTTFYVVCKKANGNVDHWESTEDRPTDADVIDELLGNDETDYAHKMLSANKFKMLLADKRLAIIDIPNKVRLIGAADEWQELEGITYDDVTVLTDLVKKMSGMDVVIEEISGASCVVVNGYAIGYVGVA